MRKYWWLIILLGVVPFLANRLDLGSGVASFRNDGDAVLAQAFDRRATSLPVQGGGVVTRVLPDDDDGSRHQRFILQLSSGQTLLVTHNIDLAPRIPGLRTGDRVEFNGVYEWNSLGGVVHWTHHDPQGRREPGWLRHKGQTYR